MIYGVLFIVLNTPNITKNTKPLIPWIYFNIYGPR